MQIVVLLVLLALLGLLVRAQSKAPLLQYAFFGRFALLQALVVASFPLLALAAAPSLLANLLSLSLVGITLVSLLAVLNAWVALVGLELVVRYGPLRFGADLGTLRLPDWLARHRYGLSAALLAAPMVLAVVVVSPSPFYQGLGLELLEQDTVLRQPGPRLALVALLTKGGAAAVGVALAVGFLYLALFLRARWGALDDLHDSLRIGPPSDLAREIAASRAAQPPPAPARPLWSRLPRWLQQELLLGYVDPQSRHLLPGQRLALSFFATTLVIYALFFFVGYARLRHGSSPPALVYVLWITLLLGWGMPGVSFFLDRFRVPVLLPLVGLSFLTSWLAGTDHTFTISRRAVAPSKPAEVFQAAEAKTGETQGPVVVVAASGGGITASLWTAKVLTALQQNVGDEFPRSVRLISSASGGSVGALFYLDRFSAEGFPPPEAAPEILDAAGRSSLDAVAWGLAYPDFWRMFFGELVPRRLDRAWALEQSWTRDLRHPEATLGDWQRKIADGWLPAAVLNSTHVETGNPFLLTGLDLAGSLGDYTFFGTYPGFDVPAVTAARLSATFPFVTPITRPSAGEAANGLPADLAARLSRHYADGGYFDNFGIVSAIRWLGSLDEASRQEVRDRGLLLVRIRAFPRDEPDGKAETGWIYSTLGPVQTLLNAWGSAQNVRGDVEVEMLRQILDAMQIRSTMACFTRTGPAPLSWKLTWEEKREILAAWGQQGNQEAAQAVSAVFAGEHPQTATGCR